MTIQIQEGICRNDMIVIFVFALTVLVTYVLAKKIIRHRRFTGFFDNLEAEYSQKDKKKNEDI